MYFVGYLYITDLINAHKMEHNKIGTLYLCFCSKFL